ncbi:fucose mutarotase isoform X2 [Tachysurus fulvidraco]|uniref:fucose mutarotase isoform X2 n=1 Tax=Tachysurus fulvidraco TaxID=1234273 RepID=UPI000F516A12|nr:fucose mutarotase isoform X2 [Tachysurus fulvidraco]
MPWLKWGTETNWIFEQISNTGAPDTAVLKLIDPQLRYHLVSGHPPPLIGVLADANFPVSSICKCGPIEIRADGLRIPELLQAILKLFPLDSYVKCPAAVMDLVDSDRQQGLVVPVWSFYSALLKQVGSDGTFDAVERFAFYERAKKAFAVVATGETALYGNIIIKKGVLRPEELC